MPRNALPVLLALALVLAGVGVAGTVLGEERTEHGWRNGR